MYGDLIEIVGTAPLQRDQLFYGRKVDVQDIPVQSHFPYISPGVGNARLGHPLMDGRQLVRRYHNVQMDIPLAVLHQRSSSRPFRRSLVGHIGLVHLLKDSKQVVRSMEYIFRAKHSKRMITGIHWQVVSMMMECLFRRSGIT